MNPDENYRLELVPAKRVKRMPGPQIGATRKEIGKIRDFVRKRGYCKPIVLSDSEGCMALIAGAATYEACLEAKKAKVPAVIVRTEGEADNLMFALEVAGLGEAPDGVAVGGAIVRLIDTHGVPRKRIAETLGKSTAWLNRHENLSRKLNVAVQKLVTEGQIPQRSAQEIARLPDDVQMPFAVSVGNECLNKENVTYLVNRYLNEDTDAQERNRIIRTPRMALPNELKRRGRMGMDKSDSARLARAIAGCMNSASYLSNLVDRIDIGETAIRPQDVQTLTDALSALQQRLRALLPQGKDKEGKNKDGGGADDDRPGSVR